MMDIIHRLDRAASAARTLPGLIDATRDVSDPDEVARRLSMVAATIRAIEKDVYTAAVAALSADSDIQHAPLWLALMTLLKDEAKIRHRLAAAVELLRNDEDAARGAMTAARNVARELALGAGMEV